MNNGVGSGAVAAVATTQQAAVADALSTTGVMWQLALQNMTSKGHGSVLDQLDAVHSIFTGYYQPYTIELVNSTLSMAIKTRIPSLSHYLPGHLYKC